MKYQRGANQASCRPGLVSVELALTLVLVINQPPMTVGVFLVKYFAFVLSVF